MLADAHLTMDDDRRRDGSDAGWCLRVSDVSTDREPWAETVCALSNGALGVRGVLEEAPAGRATTFLSAAFEQAPIHYHEQLKGFATATDTRVPVADGTVIELLVDGVSLDRTGGPSRSERVLDLRSGVLTRHSIWDTAHGRIAITAERIVPFDRAATIATRLTVEALDMAVSIELRSLLLPPVAAVGQSDDPRIGTLGAGQGLRTIACDAARGRLVQSTRHSSIEIAAAMAHDLVGEAFDCRDGIGSRIVARIEPGRPLRIEKAVAYRWHDIGATQHGSETADAQAAIDIGFSALVEKQRAVLAEFWANGGVSIEGDDEAALALRLNMFHVFQAASRTGESGVAAKGLTGEGYEGHCFWDGEIFVLPMLACTAPALARAMLDYRFSTIEAARANARALDLDAGALFAWRTIAGRECSAHYPSGSAQYHINANVAFAIGLYDAATGDTDFLADKGMEMLVETVRIWPLLGHQASDGSGEFRIHGVTGPDEYTALIDNNWYTNRMAQAHLRLAADTADRLARERPDAWRTIADRLAVTVEEIAGWRAIADAMRLPYDDALDIDAQDDSFLTKPRWDIAGTPPDKFPLLIHFHPMTLYRHQVAKQADLVHALILAGGGIDRDRKRRAFDYYASVTVHDSTLSACAFSILASEVGREADAMRHFREATFVDLEDRHRNTHHGAHMAAMAGSWQALVWGFAGFRPVDGVPHFAPMLPSGWNGYRFALLWRGSRLDVEVTADGVSYAVGAGSMLTIRHRGEDVVIEPGTSRRFGAIE